MKYAKAPSTKKTWRDSLPIDMLLSAVSVLVVAQSSSETPKGIMNNPVLHVDNLALWKIITEEDAVLTPTNLGENFSSGFLHSVGLRTYQHPGTWKLLKIC